MSKTIFLVGMPGVGKSTVGRKLAAALQRLFVDLDEFIQHQHRKSIREIFREQGEGYFRQAEADALRTLASQAPGAVVATGGGAPCFHNNMELMNQAGTTVFLDAPARMIADRLMTGREQRPMTAGKSADEIYGFVNETLTARLQFYQKAQIIYPNINRDIADLVQAIQAKENPH